MKSEQHVVNVSDTQNKHDFHFFIIKKIHWQKKENICQRSL